MEEMNVAIIGYKFMGKAHSNAWKNAPLFFDLPIRPVMKVACGRNEENLRAFADNWGWQQIETDWQKVVQRNDIDIIDICVPTYLHRDIAIAAARSGKHILCEKPMALNYEQGAEMYEAVEKAGVIHFLNHNYRKCPAIILAKQIIEKGSLGRIFHWRGTYLQDWIVSPDFPLTWQLQARFAGAGPHYDLNSHSVDLARYLVGEIRTVQAQAAHFVTERPMPDEKGDTAFTAKTASARKGKVDVDDAMFMIVEFDNGALGSFEASRFALGRKNYNYFEIYGSDGSLIFDLQRMNELQLLSARDPDHLQGFRTIQATHPNHPYMSHWWPPGHIIGYEHEFIHSVVEFINAIETKELAAPNFYDGMKVMQILGAAIESAHSGRKVVIK